MYRDEDEAAKLRIETLEAKVAERDAALAARDAELGELEAKVARLQGAAGGARPARPVNVTAPVVACALAIVAGVAGFVLMRQGQPAQGQPAPLPVVAVGDTGVPECDAYLQQMETCLAKMPDSAREPARQAVQQTRDAWKSAAATPGGRAALPQACLQAQQALARNPMCR